MYLLFLVQNDQLIPDYPMYSFGVDIVPTSLDREWYETPSKLSEPLFTITQTQLARNISDDKFRPGMVPEQQPLPPCEFCKDNQNLNKINRRYWRWEHWGGWKEEGLLTICKSAFIRRCQGLWIQNLHNQPSKRRTFSHITCENYITFTFLSLSEDIYIWI